MQATSKWLSALLITGTSILAGCQGGNSGDGDGSERVDAGSDPSISPNIISFSTNTSTMTENDTIRFTAIVTSPMGIDTIIGGSLKSPQGQTYGAFQTAASEGAYELSLAWSDINTAQAIAPLDMGQAAERVFVAEFFDEAGNSSTQQTTVGVGCAAPTEGVCDAAARCIDMASSQDNCGSCDTDLGLDTVSYCDEGAAQCFGPRDQACEQWLQQNFDDAPVIWCEDTCEFQTPIDDLTQSCDQYCSSIGAVCTRSYSSYTNSPLSGECEWIWSPSNSYGDLLSVTCKCEYL